MNNEYPYTQMILNKILKVVEEIPLETNTTNDFVNGENCFRNKVIKELKNEDKM